MTRDEALNKYYDAIGDNARDFNRNRELVEPVIDGLVALGLLELDEPESEYSRIQKKLPGPLWDWVGAKGSYDDFLRRLADAGLKIVEA